MDGIIALAFAKKLYGLQKGPKGDPGEVSEAELIAALAAYAKIDGSYDNLTAGNAKQLVSTVRANDKVPYNFRTSGGSVDIGDREYINAITGGSLAWNQLVNSGDTSVTVPSGHKYYSNINNVKTIGSSNGSAISINDSTKDNVIDLTQMFGSTIADYIYTLETNHAGDGVAWFKKLFPKPYYAYDSGSIQSVKTSKHKTVGFNALSENIVIGKRWQNGVYGDSPSNKYCASPAKIEVVPNTTYCISAKDISANTYAYITCFDANGNWDGLDYIGAGVLMTTSQPYHTFTTRENTHFITATLYRSTDFTSAEVAEVNINLSWDGSRNGEYEPYEAHEYALDSDLTLRGIPKLDANNSLYYDGDTYESDGTVTRKYEIVDLGSKTWTYNTGGALVRPRFYTGLPKRAYVAQYWASNCIMSTGKYAKGASVGQHDVDMEYGLTTDNIFITDSNYTDETAFKTAMSGIYLVYEIATPTTETADPYQSPQIVDDFGTEEYVDTRDVAIPVGHDTDYPINILAKVEMAPNSPDGDGDYIVRQTNGENAYVPLVIEDALPTMPSTAGEYRLIVTIADGEDPVLSWEAQE